MIFDDLCACVPIVMDSFPLWKIIDRPCIEIIVEKSHLGRNVSMNLGVKITKCFSTDHLVTIVRYDNILWTGYRAKKSLCSVSHKAFVIPFLFKSCVLAVIQRHVSEWNVKNSMGILFESTIVKKKLFFYSSMRVLSFCQDIVVNKRVSYL